MPQSDPDLDLSLSRTFIAQDNGQLLPLKIPSSANQIIAPGTIIDGKYKIISLLGEGGMGSVYRVHHMLLDKEMALKTFRSQHIEKEASRRFELEARAIARLSHKNIVQVFDFGLTADGRPFYTMELLSGKSLVKYVANRSLSLKETLEIFIEVADGLAHAHKAGIIHRDIKPDNIHLGAPVGKAGKISSVKIVDFGIAKLVMESKIEESNPQDQMITKAGRIFGSPLYMSPEQSIGLPTDHRTDIYSFGCTLFEAISWRPPFVGADSRATLSCHRLDTPPSLSQCSPDRVFPQRLEALLARLLKKEKQDRLQSFAEVKQELAQILATLAGGHLKEETSIAKKAETALHPNNASQAKTDPLLAADRALSQLLQTNSKAILFAGLVGLSALAAVFAWSVMAGDRHQNRADKNKPAAALLSAGAAVNPATAPTPPGVWAPGAKFLTSETATTKIFDFPAGEQIGLLHSDRGEVPATGHVEIPKNGWCRLLAEHPIAIAPQLLSGFGANDLSEIRFASTETWTDRHMKWVSKLSGLQEIDLDNCDLTAASINYLSNLRNLRKITLDGSHIKANQWCGLRQLPDLVEIKASDLQNCSALLTKLKQKNSLQCLEIVASDISDSSLANIASFKRLTKLKLIGGTVTTRGLKTLLALPKLDHLCIAGSNIGPDSIEIFAAMPALVDLEIETGSWGLRNQRRIFELMRAKKIQLKQTCPGSGND